MNKFVATLGAAALLLAAGQASAATEVADFASGNTALAAAGVSAAAIGAAAALSDSSTNSATATATGTSTTTATN